MADCTYKIAALGDRHSLIKITNQVAIIKLALKRPGKEGRLTRVVSAYFGFDSLTTAIAFVSVVRQRFPRAWCLERPSTRLSTPFEVKVRETEGLEQFAWEMAALPEIASPERARSAIAPSAPFGRDTARLANRSRSKQVGYVCIE